jgi:hypothetical protein
MDEIKQQAMAARAQLKSELESIYKAVKDNNPVGGLHGCNFVVEFSHLARLEQLVATFSDKGDDLSVFFAEDPNRLISDICKGVPAYLNAGEEQVGYSIRLTVLNRIKDLVKVERGGLDTLTPVVVDPVANMQQQQVNEARAQLKLELESICNEIVGDGLRIGAYGFYHVVRYPLFRRLEQLVETYLDKGKELSSPLFSTDPKFVLAGIRAATPAYDAYGEGGRVRIGYAVRDPVVRAIGALSHTGEPQQFGQASLLLQAYFSVSNEEQVMVARAQLKHQLESFCAEIIGENGSPEGTHAFGLHHTISHEQYNRLVRLVHTYLEKSQVLSAPLFSTDPKLMLAVINTSIPAFGDGGMVRVGYAVKDSLVKLIKGLAYGSEPQRGVDSSLPAAPDSAVKAEFEQWYREDISNEPADLEKWGNGVYLHESTFHYFKGFLGGLARRKAAAEGEPAEEAENVQPRLDALIVQVSQQLAKSREVLGQPG